MDATHHETAAVTLVRDFRDRFAPLISEGMGEVLLVQIQALVRAAVRQERRECEDICAARAALWNAAIARHEFGPLRAEAENREKEARYLADAIGVRD
jgi:hypothetical protein